jgi:hypothetical protein
MNFTQHAANRDPIDRTFLVTRRIVSIAWTTTRLAIYSVLAILEPVIVWVTGAMALICLALCAFFGLLVRAPHFPTTFVLLLGVGSALSLVVYYALMEFLLPE